MGDGSDILAGAGTGAAAGSVLGPVGAGVGAAVGLVAMLIGKALAAGDRQKAAELRAQALARFGDAVAPQLDSLAKSHLYEEDPALKGAQMGALNQLTQTGNGTLDAQGRAMQAQAQMEAAQSERGYSQGLDQQMQARGLSGSGLEYLGHQMGIQGAANSLYSAGTNAASAREQALISRMSAGASLAGQMRSEGQEANRAQDAIDKFNSGLQQKRWENDMRLREDKYAAERGAANDYLGYAKDTESAAIGAGQAIGGGFNDAAKAYVTDPDNPGAKKRGQPL